MKKEEFNTKIGRTQLSWFLDTEHRKDNISATHLEVYYDEIFEIVKEAENKEYQRIKRYLKKQGIAPDLREPVATKLGGNQPESVKKKISKSIKEHWKTRKTNSPI